MAVIQISKIQHRRGPVGDLPRGTVENPVGLKDGELGFTNDTGQLFIGSPNVPAVQDRKPNSVNPNGVFPFANTQILTEWSRNVEELIPYQYRYRNARDNQDFPGPGSSLTWAYDLARPWNRENTPVIRPLQERLDEVVSVKAYGAVGDGITDDTYAIWRAALDVSKQTTITAPEGEVTVGHRRALYFPAGVYRITRPAILPPGSHWYGDGVGRSILRLTTVSGDFTSSCVVETVDSGLTLDDLLGNYNLVAPTHLPRTEYQIGTAIPGTSLDGDLPTDIVVRDMDFQHRGSSYLFPSRDIIRLLRSSNTAWMGCRFSGVDISPGKTIAQYSQNVTTVTVNTGAGGSSSTYNAADTTSTSPDSIGVFIDGLGDIIDPSNHLFSNCQFHSTTYAFSITDQVQNVVIDGCTFDTHYRAISLGEEILDNPAAGRSPGLHTLPGTGLPNQVNGPSGFRITNCHFQNIIAEAVYVHRGRDVVLTGNTFLDTIGRGVGFNIAGAVSAPVVYFGTEARACGSVLDWFSRPVTLGETAQKKRLLYDGMAGHLVIDWTDSPSIPHYITATMEMTVPAGTTDLPLTFPLRDSSYMVEYSLLNLTTTTMPRRVGEMAVMTVYHQDTPSMSEGFLSDVIKVEKLNCGVEFSLQATSGGINLRAVNTSGFSYQMVFRIRTIQTT